MNKFVLILIVALGLLIPTSAFAEANNDLGVTVEQFGSPSWKTQEQLDEQVNAAIQSGYSSFLFYVEGGDLLFFAAKSEITYDDVTKRLSTADGTQLALYPGGFSHSTTPQLFNSNFYWGAEQTVVDSAVKKKSAFLPARMSTGIPSVVKSYLVDGGILSTGLIVLAIGLGVLLVPRLIYSFRP